ncbi:MAG: hypothetical protein Q9222_003977 [Ikaeria aurantiellina]
MRGRRAVTRTELSSLFADGNKQRCIPRGFGPPANCGSLSNRTCICGSVEFANTVDPCELLSCSAEENDQITALGSRLCADLGGFTSASVGYDQFLSTAQLDITATPTFPPTVTAVDEASSVLATASLVPDYGNPVADPISTVYPQCAVRYIQTISLRGFVRTLPSAKPPFAPTVTDKVSQSPDHPSSIKCPQPLLSDKLVTQLISQELCRPFFRYNQALGSSVIASLASATSIAQMAVAGKDSSDIASYPACAQSCILSSNYAGCGSNDDPACVCGNSSGINAGDDDDDDAFSGL